MSRVLLKRWLAGLTALLMAGVALTSLDAQGPGPKGKDKGKAAMRRRGRRNGPRAARKSRGAGGTREGNHVRLCTAAGGCRGAGRHRIAAEPVGA
jgi:hypothetical protein